MSLIKLAIYGGIGYLVYQTFFSEEASTGSSQGGSRGGSSRQGQRRSTGGSQMTGGGKGQTEKTEDASGASTGHRVGRGVI